MRNLTIIGLLLIAFGLVGLVTGGFSYKKKETTELGPVDISIKKEKHVAIPTGVSVAAVVGGVALLLVGARRRGSA